MTVYTQGGNFVNYFGLAVPISSTVPANIDPPTFTQSLRYVRGVEDSWEFDFDVTSVAPGSTGIHRWFQNSRGAGISDIYEDELAALDQTVTTSFPEGFLTIGETLTVLVASRDAVGAIGRVTQIFTIAQDQGPLPANTTLPSLVIQNSLPIRVGATAQVVPGVWTNATSTQSYIELLNDANNILATYPQNTLTITQDLLGGYLRAAEDGIGAFGQRVKAVSTPKLGPIAAEPAVPVGPAALTSGDWTVIYGDDTRVAGVQTAMLIKITNPAHPAWDATRLYWTSLSTVPTTTHGAFNQAEKHPDWNNSSSVYYRTWLQLGVQGEMPPWADRTQEPQGTLYNIVTRYTIESLAVAAVDAVYSLNSNSLATNIIHVRAPVNTSPPNITGSLTTGSTLTSSAGGFSGYPVPVVTYQWQRNTTNISGATSATYVSQPADEGSTLRTVTTAVNAVGSTTGTSAPTGVITPAAGSIPVNTTAPVLSGSPEENEGMACSTGVWTNTPLSYAYQWRADGVSISGATDDVYVWSTAEVGKIPSCRVTATNAAGSASVVVTGTEAIRPTENLLATYIIQPMHLPVRGSLPPQDGGQVLLSFDQSLSNPSTMYVAQDTGAFRRSDTGGTSWFTLANRGIKSPYGISICCDPVDHNRVLSVNGNRIVVSPTDPGINLSVNGGVDWTQRFTWPSFGEPRTMTRRLAYAQPEKGATLAAAINSSVLSLTLTNSTEANKYPTAGTALIGTERVRYTRSGTAVTLTARGADGTTAASHATSDVFFDRTRAQRWYCICDSSARFAGIGGPGVPGLLTSADGGVTWAQVPNTAINNLPAATFGTSIFGGRVDPSDATKLYIYGSAGLFRITNPSASGATFTRISGTGGLPLGAVQADVNISDDGVRMIIPVQGVGVYRSVNSGVTWTQIHAWVNLRHVIVNSSNENYMYLIPNEGFRIRRTTNGLNATPTFTEPTTIQPRPDTSGVENLSSNVAAIIADYSNVNKVISFSNADWWTSLDAGVTFNYDGKYYLGQQHKGHAHDHIFTDNPQVWYLPLLDFGGSKTIDGGRTWTRLSIRAGASSTNGFAVHRDGITCLASTDRGTTGALYRSVNGGGIWTLLPAPEGVTREDNYYVGFGRGTLDGDIAYLERRVSINKGATWADLNMPEAGATICGVSRIPVAVSGGTRSVLYAYNKRSAQNSFWKSIDGAVTWTLIKVASPDTVSANYIMRAPDDGRIVFRIDPSNPYRIFTKGPIVNGGTQIREWITSGALATTRDFNVFSETPVPSGFYAEAFAIDAYKPEVMYLRGNFPETGEYAWVTKDDGSTWENISKGFPNNTGGRGWEVHPQTGVLLVGTANGNWQRNPPYALPPADIYKLSYDAKTTPFPTTTFSIVGATSGATGTVFREVVADAVSGYLEVYSRSGTFVDNEFIRVAGINMASVNQTGVPALLLSVSANSHALLKSTYPNWVHSPHNDAAPLLATTLPRVTGSLIQGQTVTAVGGVYNLPVTRNGFRWSQYNGSIVTGTGNTFVLDGKPNMVLTEDVTDQAGRQLGASSIVYAVAPLANSPVFSTNPSITGTGVVGTTVTRTNGIATGTPTPTLTTQWYLDNVLVSGSTGGTFTPTTAMDGQRLKARNTATNTGGSTLSAFSNEITISVEATNVINVTSAATLLSALASANGGDEIRCAPGNYGTVSAPARTMNPRIRITAQNPANPPVFQTGMTLDNWRGLNIDNLTFIDTRQETVTTNGITSTTGTGSNLKLNDARNWTVTDCLFDNGLVGIQARDIFDAEIGYNTFTRCGKDNIQVYGGQTNVYIHHNLIHQTRVDEQRVGQADRHPDGIQWATNANAAGTVVDLLIRNVRVEDNWIENRQTLHSMHGAFFGHNVIRPTANGGRSMSFALYHSEDVVVKRNYFLLGHLQGIFFEGILRGTVEGNLLRTIPGVTNDGDKPTICLWYGTNQQIVLKDNVTPRSIVNQGNSTPANQITSTGNQVSTTAVPPGWVFPVAGRGAAR